MKILKAAKFATLHKNTATMLDLREQKEAIEAKYKAAIADTIETVVEVLRQNPNAGMTCGDIAGVTGLNTAMISHAMACRPDVTGYKTHVSRQFIELDEDGDPIPGAIKTEEYQRTVYQYVGGRRRNEW